MDFDFKKARKNKQRQDKVRSTHHHQPNQKKNPDQQSKQNNDGRASSAKGHATPLPTIEKPGSYTETDPAQFQHLKRETEDIAALSETKSYSRRVIASNWERYELPPDTPEEESEEALDFETLINSLSDVKGHLKLSHEQYWGDERSELQEVFFNIDMHKLFASLERVPFHTRQNLPVELFTPEQLLAFEEDAEKAWKQSCLSKIAPKDTEPWQKLPVISTKASSKMQVEPCQISDVLPPIQPEESSSDILPSVNTTESTHIPGPSFIKKSPLKIESEAKASGIPAEVPPSTEDSAKTTKSSVSLKSDELDLDFLLSLDAAVPDKPKDPRPVNALASTTTSSIEASGAGKLDDWLDDLLDD